MTPEELVKARDEAREVLPGVIETLGILEVFEACISACHNVGRDEYDAILFAHKVFTRAMGFWESDNIE